MGSQLFIGLLNPGIGILLAAAFFLLWINQRSQTYVAMAAASYVLVAVAFLIQDVAPALSMDLNRLPANICFLLAACLLVGAVLKRYGIAVPYLAFAALLAIGAAGMWWLLIEQPNLTVRIYLINFLLGTIAAIGAVKLHGVEKRHAIDRLLFWVTVLSAANFYLRPTAIMVFVGTFDDFDSFQQSLYWTTVQFTQALISVMFALNLMVAIAMDLIVELKRDANTDKLSGLLNRRGFEQEAAAVLSRCHARGVPACLLIADLDHFKQINDNWGHAVGDRVISLFGQQIAAQMDENMVAGRIGGEEFAVIVSGVGLGGARQFAESLRSGLSGQTAVKLPRGLAPTVSIGLCLSFPGTDLYGLMRQADEALYNAKGLGRDQVQVFMPHTTEAAAAPQPRAARA